MFLCQSCHVGDKPKYTHYKEETIQIRLYVCITYNIVINYSKYELPLKYVRQYFIRKFVACLKSQNMVVTIAV